MAPSVSLASVDRAEDFRFVKVAKRCDAIRINSFSANEMGVAKSVNSCDPSGRTWAFSVTGASAHGHGTLAPDRIVTQLYTGDPIYRSTTSNSEDKI